MPDGNTASLSDYIRMRFPDTAILSVTGRGVCPYGEHTEMLSSDYILRKPVRETDLAAVAEHLLRSNLQRA